MKKLIVMFVLTIMFITAGCGDSRIVDGKYCDTYGLVNKHETKCANVQYRVIKGNVFWGVILVNTIVAPIYFFGFSLYEPALLK